MKKKHNSKKAKLGMDKQSKSKEKKWLQFLAHFNVLILHIPLAQ